MTNKEMVNLKKIGLLGIFRYALAVNCVNNTGGRELNGIEQIWLDPIFQSAKCKCPR